MGFYVSRLCATGTTVVLYVLPGSTGVHPVHVYTPYTPLEALQIEFP